MGQILNQVKRRTLIAGNWKMNGSLATNAQLLDDIVVASSEANSSSEVLVCAPFVYLSQLQEKLMSTEVRWGSQDVSSKKMGAYTGEVAASMLSDFSCGYVIVGHSERRAYHLESNELVAQKALRAIESGLTAIVCVGETLEERESGQTNAIVSAQLKAVLEVLSDDDLNKIVVAYEPVWAIGTGKTATPEMAQEVHADLRALIAARNMVVAEKVRILYGGSMKPDNAKELLSMPDIDGGLIGGASLKAVDFFAIVNAA